VTGFASQVTSVGYLDVRLENDFGQNEEEESRLTRLSHLYPTFPFLEDTQEDGGGRREKEGARNSGNMSRSELAHVLFTKLLSYTEVCTAVTREGDTALSTLVHNPKCMAALEKTANSSKDETPASAKTPGGFPSSLLSLSEMIRDSRRSMSLQRAGMEQGQTSSMKSTASSVSTFSLNPGFHGNQPTTSSQAYRYGTPPPHPRPTGTERQHYRRHWQREPVKPVRNRYHQLPKPVPPPVHLKA
jgi:hypothetical protein